MRSGNLAALTMALALGLRGVSTGAAEAPNPEVGHDPAANAALKYWKAFALMPSLDKDQEKILAEWNKVPLDAAALKIIAGSDKSLLYLHRGAKLRRCDWSPDYDDGMELLLPHLSKARDLARLAALHARHEFEQGRWESGVEDANSMMALARHVGSEPPFMICLMVRYAIESLAIDLLASYLPDLKGLSPRILSAYESLPAGASFPQMFRSERSMVDWLLKKMKATEQDRKGAWRDAWKSAFAWEESPPAVTQVDSFDRAVELTEELFSAYDRLAEVVALPREEFDRQYPSFKAKENAANPMAEVFLPAMDKIFATVHRNQARLAMLKAAMAVVRGGPDRLKEIKDPFGAGPFEYRPLDNGFELKSKLLFHDQPVSLTVGRGEEVTDRIDP